MFLCGANRTVRPRFFFKRIKLLTVIIVIHKLVLETYLTVSTGTGLTFTKYALTTVGYASIN